MRAFFRRLGRAAEASIEFHGEGKFQVRGKRVVCPVCGLDDFVKAPGSEVKRPLFMRLNLPWISLDRSSTTLICTHCSHLMSFGRAPARDDTGRVN